MFVHNSRVLLTWLSSMYETGNTLPSPFTLQLDRIDFLFSTRQLRLPNLHWLTRCKNQCQIRQLFTNLKDVERSISSLNLANIQGARGWDLSPTNDGNESWAAALDSTPPIQLTFVPNQIKKRHYITNPLHIEIEEAMKKRKSTGVPV